MKNLYFKTMLLCICLFDSSNAFAYDAEIDGIYYNFQNDEAIVTYRNYNYNSYSGSVTIPSSVTYSGTTYTVTSIGNWAFEYCTNLTSVTIPYGVTSIGDDAFEGCSGLTSITIPESVISIGSEAFYGCSSLSSIDIPSSVTSIGYYAFYNTAWYNSKSNGLIYAGKVAYKYKGTMPSGTTITISNGTKGIAGSAFSGCSGLTAVTIPNSVTNIGMNAFAGCSNLSNINIPNSVTCIGVDAFEATAWYNNQPNGIVYAGKFAYTYKGTMPNGTAITIKEETKGIVDFAFYGCSGLTSITFPSSMETIGENAFSHCSSLTNITIPYRVTSIGSYAFWDCSSLTSITFGNGRQLTSIGYGAFKGCCGLKAVKISDLAAWCNIQFKDKDSNPLSYAHHLHKNGQEITELNIPKGVTKIGHYAFYDCTSLTSVSIPNSVTTIGEEAFFGCNNLTDVWCSAKRVPTTYNNVFYNSSIIYAILHVPAGSVDAYSNSYPWNEFYNIVPSDFIDFAHFLVKDICVYNWDTNEDGELSKDEAAAVKSLGGEFSERETITSFNELQYFTGLTRIEGFEFESCYSLSSIAIPSSVTSIGTYAFSSCDLKAVHITDLTAWCNIQFDDDPLFSADHLYLNDEEIKDLIIPEDVTCIGNNAFEYCTGLTSVTIPGNVTSIEDYAFRGCSGVTSVIIGSSMTSIGNEALEYCTGLKEIYCYAVEPPTVSSNTFYGVNKNEVTLIVPDEAYEQYKAHPVWGQFLIETPTGIANLDANVNLNANENFYNLASQCLSKPQKGINVVNGKKILIK